MISKINRLTIYSMALTTLVGLLIISNASAEDNHKNISLDKLAPSQSSASQHNKLIVESQNLISKINLNGHILPLSTIDISAPTNAKVENIYVQLGQKVKQGQLLLELRSDQLDMDIRNATESQIRAEIEYNKKQAWLNSDDVFQAKQANLKNKLNYQRASDVYTQNKILHKQGIISQNELEQSEINYNDAKLNLELSSRHLQQIIRQGDDIQLKLLKLSLDNARAKLNILNNIKEKLSIRSPINGVILRANKRSKENNNSNVLSLISEGQNIATGENILAIGNLTGFAVNIQANEQVVQTIKLNQKVMVKIPALQNNTEFEGIVTAIDAQPNNSENTSQPPKYNITIHSDYDSNEHNIFLGMTAKISFDLIEQENALTIPFTSITYKDKQPYAVNWHDQSLIKISLGKTSIDKIEVTSGLKAGDIIQKNAIS